MIYLDPDPAWQQQEQPDDWYADETDYDTGPGDTDHRPTCEHGRTFAEPCEQCETEPPPWQLPT